MHAHLRALPAATIEAARAQRTRVAHADELHVAGDSDAYVATLRTQAGLALAPFDVADGASGFFEAALIVAAVPADHRVAIRRVRKLVGADQVEPAQFERVDAERLGHRIHRALNDVGRLRPAGAPVSVDRRRVGRDQPHLGVERGDVVVAGDVGGSVDRRNAGRHVREIGAEIRDRAQLDPEHPPVALDCGLDELGVRPPVGGGDMAFAAGLGPADRSVEVPGGERDEDLFGIEMHLGAEAATDVGRDQVDAMLWPAQSFGQPAPRHVRHLARQVDRQALVGGVERRTNRARLHRARDQPLIDETQRHQPVGRRGGARIVAAARLVRADQVAGHVGVQLRRIGRERGDLVHNGRQQLVIDADRLDRIGRLLARLRDDEGHCLADVAHALASKRRVRRHDRIADHPVGPDVADAPVEVGMRQDADDAGHFKGRRGVDREDARMAVRRAQYCRVGQARHLHVVGVAAPAGQQLRVFAPQDRLAHQRHVHGFARGIHQTVSARVWGAGCAAARRAASNTASTMFW